MNRRLMLCLVAIGLVGCNTPLDPDAEEAEEAIPLTCLTLDEVINIPPGNATGTKGWGTYRAVSNFRKSCTQCDQNAIPDATCTDAPVYPDVRTTFSQQGGVLTAQDTEGTVMRGGINTDGTFTLGGVVTPVRDDGVPTGQGLALMEGRFVGDQIVATMTMRLTVNFPGGVVDLESVHAVTHERTD